MAYDPAWPEHFATLRDRIAYTDAKTACVASILVRAVVAPLLDNI